MIDQIMSFHIKISFMTSSELEYGFGNGVATTSYIIDKPRKQLCRPIEKTKST